ncbi:FAD-dependent oxidoreductase [Clostridium sp. Cult1]|uniref:FAD-dependent oxidoreductase n=1 Tax=Clostridium sp. Cult1 TaxID=2079002 RepID=UPI001F207572|nr:FAD-dependent oxidoreductase [Clostridium sp. Cult1]MCF6462949.1 hypothetical protein [Clostridium sp. Cult1]
MNKKDCKIAVVGGGLSGLVIAEGLERKGYNNVTLFEENVRLGGKLYTIWYEGKSYELGAIFGLPSYSSLKALMDRLNIIADGPKLSRTNYNAEGEKIMPIPKEDLEGFLEEIERLPKVLDTYESLSNANIKDIETILMEPFSKWCDIHAFKVLKTVYIHYFTIFGLGNIDEVPALYVLKIMNYNHLMCFMNIPQFYTWKRGVSVLAESLGNRIKDVRLGQRVEDIRLSTKGSLWISTPFEEIEFHKVIITAPLEQFCDLYFWDEEMKGYLNSIKYQHFNVYAFVVDNVPKGCGCILENLSHKRRGHITIWDSRWNVQNDEGMVILYAYNPPNSSKLLPLDYIKDDLFRLGVKNPRLYQAKSWRHCPYVDTNVLAQGFYQKMDAVQGENNIFLAGEIMSGLSIENCIQYSEYLLEEFF